MNTRQPAGHTTRAATLAAILASASTNAYSLARRLGGKVAKPRRRGGPHQRKRECARRRRNIERGKVPTAQRLMGVAP